MLIYVVCLLLALSVIFIGSPSWRNPPIGVGMLIAAVTAAISIWLLIGLGPHR